MARPGVSATTLTGRVQALLGGSDLTVLGLAKIGQAEDLAVGTDKLALLQLATTIAVDVGAIAFFVVAGTIALSVALRWRNLALLRAVGATPGQVRRMIWLELAMLGAVAGLAAYLPGLGERTGPCVVGRAPDAPALAPCLDQSLGGAHRRGRGNRVRGDSWRRVGAAGQPHPPGRGAGRGDGRTAAHPPGAPAARPVRSGRRRRDVHPDDDGYFSTERGTFAPGLPCPHIAIALLGPVLVSLAELLVRFPLLLVSGVGGRLALADIKKASAPGWRQRSPRSRSVSRSSVPTTPIDVTLTHGAVVQGGERLVADAAVSAPGPELAPAALPAIASQPGVSTAVGLTPTTVFVPYPNNDANLAEAVTPGPLSAVLNLEGGLGEPKPLRSGRHSAQQGHHRP